MFIIYFLKGLFKIIMLIPILIFLLIMGTIHHIVKVGGGDFPEKLHNFLDYLTQL